MPVEVVDSRRLTGANIHTRGPGAVLELRFDAGCSADAVSSVVDGWRVALAEGLAQIGWTATLHERRFLDDVAGRPGAELMFTAAVDRLYAATELNEWALARALGQLDDAAAVARLAEIATAAEAEQAKRRGAVELVAAAEARGVIWLVDDDQLSLGQYADVRIWPIDALPSVDSVDWASFERRPLVLITGTNGKTTTTRILTRILRKHGLRVGNTSTDGLCVDEQLIDSGDWTGPGGARTILRHREIDVALLEAARGGLLRRGVGVPRADVAVVTNVARDHLGEYGVFDLAGMAAAKGVITSVVDAGGRVVLGAESPAIVEWARARELAATTVWFGLDPEHPVVRDAIASGAEVWTVQDGFVVRCEGQVVHALCRVEAMPLSLAGHARHNVANALAAAAAARGLGVSDEVIAAALLEFGREPTDNPGRAHVWRIPREGRPLRVFVDFAHNLAGFAAIRDIIRSLARECEQGPVLCFGMAGDRSDDELRELGAALLDFEPSAVILREQPHYMRGRELGEVPGLIEQGLVAAGFDRRRISSAADEPSSIAQAIELGAELIVILVHTEREALAQCLLAHDARADSMP